MRVVSVILALLFVSPAMATPRGGSGWHDKKCVLYRQAWDRALAKQGRTGLGVDFLAAHDAFLKSNCMRRADVCARSAEEVELANTMVVLSMNFGAASTLAPFYCRR